MLTPSTIVLGLGTIFLVASLLVEKVVKQKWEQEFFSMTFTGVYLGLFLANLIFTLMR